MSHISTQKIILNSEGRILSSCDTLFNTSSYIGLPLRVWSPLLASIFEDIIKGLDLLRLLEIPRVVTPVIQIEGLFNCTFKRAQTEQGTDTLEWHIADIKAVMHKRNLIQQKFNEWRLQQSNYNQVKYIPKSIFEV